MSNVRLNWKLPTPNARQRPIARTKIEGRTSPSLPWGEINLVDAPTQTLLIQDIAPGAWEFRATVIDAGNVPSSSVTAGIDIAFDPPSPVTELSAALE